MKVTVINRGVKPLSGSLTVFSDTGAVWEFLDKTECSGADTITLEVYLVASASPFIVLPSFGYDSSSGYTLEIEATTERFHVKPLIGRQPMGR